MKIRNLSTICLLCAAFFSMASGPAFGAALGYTDTPLLPGGKWHVHDPNRPQPKIVKPGTVSTKKKPGKAPSDAVVLFDGTNLSKWRTGRGGPSGWKVEDGAMVVPPKNTENGGDIWTKDEFGDCQLHIEWSAPAEPKGESQERGNSGLFFFGIYELQVLDSHENKTYPDGQAGSIYGQRPPLVNASRKPGDWQTYDIAFIAPRFKEGKVEQPASITVFHNGVLVQNHVALLGATGHRTLADYKAHGPRGPLKLQDHGDPVRFRNIWVRPLNITE